MSDAAPASATPPPLIYLVKQLHATMRAAVDEALAPAGLTMTQAVVLTALAVRPGMSNADLARAGSVSPQSMVEVLGVLEKRGLVLRHPNAAGGRILQAELTPAGFAEFERTRAVAAALEQAALGQFEPADQLRLREMLQQCLSALQSNPHPAHA
ncbi:MAG: MarR family transcriptional regulator [Phenylobacterium sp.]|nr:MarR family transcriptional regulator [Phenylobacterium sp.]